jgi:hypothetical protein
MAFATVEDLATHLQKDLSAAETATAQQALDIAHSEIRAIVGQYIERVTSETVLLDPPWCDPLVLPEAPVISITSLKVGTTTLSYPNHYRWNREGFVWRRYGSWGQEPKSIELVYTHGITSADREWSALKSICLDYAARMFANPTGVQQESIGSYSITWARNSEQLSLEQEETDILRRMFGRVLVG